jgi:hypothetical protein
MPNTQAIKLKNDIEAFVVLNPMPYKRKNGSFRGYKGGQQQPDVYCTFKKYGRVIAPKVPCHLVINGKQACIISPGIVLDADDLHEIDKQGREIMSRYGMFPTVWIDPSKVD